MACWLHLTAGAKIVAPTQKMKIVLMTEMHLKWFQTPNQALNISFSQAKNTADFFSLKEYNCETTTLHTHHVFNISVASQSGSPEVP